MLVPATFAPSAGLLSASKVATETAATPKPLVMVALIR
jgi:hypothetical protein